MKVIVFKKGEKLLPMELLKKQMEVLEYTKNQNLLLSPKT